MNDFWNFIKAHWIKPLVIVALFSICLSTSILMKKWFDIDGDYLSAFATLVAAVVALYLYTDWRKPIFLNKIEDEQKEIRKCLGLFRKATDALLLFINTKTPTTVLNNGDSFSLEYQKLMYNLLDSTDDLFVLLTNYKLILNDDSHKNHIEFIEQNLNTLNLIYDVIGEYNPVTNYVDSYRYVEKRIQRKESIQLFKKIIKKLPDGLSKFYKEIYK